MGAFHKERIFFRGKIGYFSCFNFFSSYARDTDVSLYFFGDLNSHRSVRPTAPQIFFVTNYQRHIFRHWTGGKE